MNDDHPQPKRRSRGRTSQLGKINRLRWKARGRSDFVKRAIQVDAAIATAKAEARARHGT